MSSPRPRVLVVAPTNWDYAALADPALCDTHEFLWADEELAANSFWANTKPTVKLLRSGLGFNVHRWVDDTVRRFRGQQLSGILGTCDYPSCFLASAIAERLGLPAPPLRDIVRMGHKYYSRQVHTAVIPEATPDYEPLDPRQPRLGALSFPVFVKPVKGCTSARAQLAHHPGELRTILRFDAITRLRLLATLKPYQQLLTHHCDGGVPAHWFIAEAPLAGAQATVDGFVLMENKLDQWDIISSVGLTALAIAGLRAVETHRSDSLASDPFAELFVQAAKTEVPVPTRPGQLVPAA